MSRKFTENEILILQNLGPGWKELWEEISFNLVGTDGKGLLYKAATRQTKDEDLSEEVASHLCTKYHERLLAKTLFYDYDYQALQGDVYSYLCARAMIRTEIKECQKESIFYKVISLDQQDDSIGDDSKTTLSDSIPDNRRSSEPFDRRKRFSNLPECRCTAQKAE